MPVIEKIELLSQIKQPYVLTIGKFDGLHLGHKAIFDQLNAAAGTALKVAYVLNAPNQKQRILSDEERFRLLGDWHMDKVAEGEISGDFAALTADEFLQRLHCGGMLKAVAVGESFRFGKNARGTVETLGQAGERFGFEVYQVPSVQIEGEPVSSTLIRGLLAQGTVRKAAQLLGRPYALEGSVEHGNELGRTIGFPTLNVAAAPECLLPRRGVYAGYGWLDGIRYPALTNVGCRPTVSGEGISVESHLIGYEGNAYGKPARIEFLEFLRDEIRFDSLESLKNQLNTDKAAALGKII